MRANLRIALDKGQARQGAVRLPYIHLVLPFTHDFVIYMNIVAEATFPVEWAPVPLDGKGFGMRAYYENSDGNFDLPSSPGPFSLREKGKLAVAEVPL